MCIQVLLNFLNELRKRDKMRGFRNAFHQFLLIGLLEE